MAQLITETITITLSKMVKSSYHNDNVVLDEEVRASLEAVIQELAGDGVMVEIE